MIPKSLSATACHVANHCLRRYEAEYINRARGPSSGPANFGSMVHSVLEKYVRDAYIDKIIEPKFEYIQMYLMVELVIFYGDADVPERTEAETMLKEWYDRTDFTGVAVISVENKLSFDLPTSIGAIPFNYIFDRFDRLGERSFRVVDYKTLRWGFNPEDLKKKIQARAYALAASIWLKSQGLEYDDLWIEFDLLRHQSVGIKFTRDENIVTWRKLGQIAEKIIATPEGAAPATLNPECIFCTVKTTCPVLQTNIASGGVHSLTPDQQIDIRSKLDYQRKAVIAAIGDLDELIISRAKEEDAMEYETDVNRLSIVMRRSRAVDPEAVERIVGPEIFKFYGANKLTLEQFNKLLRHPGLDDDTLARLRSSVGTKTSEPSVKVEPREFTTD